MSSFEFEAADGSPLFTGLQLPASRPATFAKFADTHAALMLTRAQIEQLAGQQQRDPRKRFPPEVWIKQQINNGCNGFAAAAALGRLLYVRGGRPIVLSGDYIYAHINGGRDQGSMLDEGMQAMQSIGIAPDELVTVGTWRKNSLSQQAHEAAKRFKATECYAVDEELELLSGLALGFMGVVAVHVQRGGDYGPGPGNHSVAVDGLRTATGQLTINSPGSWGLNMGHERGCWDLTWQRHLAESSQYHQFYLIRAGQDDPQGTNPVLI